MRQVPITKDKDKERVPQNPFSKKKARMPPSSLHQTVFHSTFSGLWLGQLHKG